MAGNKTRRREGPREPDAASDTRAGVAVIGVGAVGSSLARSLHGAGYRVLALIGRSIPSAETIAQTAGAPILSDNVKDIPVDARLLFICTRESDIPTVVRRLVAADLPLSECVAAHVSGRLGADVLAPLAARGAHILSFHPLGSFPPGPSDKTFAGLTIGLEGDPLAVAVGRTVSSDLGARPVEIPTEAKTAYHLAASYTSNFLVALLDDVRVLLETRQLPPDLMYSLAADTLENVRGSTPEEVLTGPIVRGDGPALAGQIDVLMRVAPELLLRFAALATGTIDLALRSGRISRETASTLHQIVQESTES